MSLTVKDLITTILAAATLGLFYAMSRGIELPLITNYRWGVMALALIGIVMCAFSGAGKGATGPFITIASILGVAALILIVYGLVTGAKIGFVLLSFTILALWVVTTFHHLISK